MAHAPKNMPVVGQSKYWTQFLINFVAVISLLALAIVSLMSGSWGVAILAFLAIAPVGIWFRVVMVRRCRDIGWPTFLPWLLFGGGVAFNVLRIGGGSAAAFEQGSLSSVAMLPLLVGLVDFGFMVTIGCIASKQQDYAGVFDDGAVPATPGSSQPAGAQDARWDAAIAAALAAREGADAAPAQRPVAPRPALGRPGGFGRRIV
jgi:uncharacterized membrane protein YhaH (DUF805 family)